MGSSDIFGAVCDAGGEGQRQRQGQRQMQMQGQGQRQGSGGRGAKATVAGRIVYMTSVVISTRLRNGLPGGHKTMLACFFGHSRPDENCFAHHISGLNDPHYAVASLALAYQVCAVDPCVALVLH